MIKKIVEELSQLLINNKKNISDLWLYGSIDDELSDLDLICLYKKAYKNNIFQIFKEKIDDGTIIFIPKEKSKDIFLFEKLDIFSIKYRKKLKTKFHQI